MILARYISSIALAVGAILHAGHERHLRNLNIVYVSAYRQSSSTTKKVKYLYCTFKSIHIVYALNFVMLILFICIRYEYETSLIDRGSKSGLKFYPYTVP